MHHLIYIPEIFESFKVMLNLQSHCTVYLRCTTVLLPLRLLPPLTANIISATTLPSADYQANNIIDPFPVLDFGEDRWATVSEYVVSSLPRALLEDLDGLAYLIRPVSLSITLKSAPTASARSVYTTRISPIPASKSTQASL